MTPFQTIGVDFKIKNTNIEGRDYKIMFFDSAGQERFRSLPRSLYKMAHGIFIAFDLSDKQGLESVEKWMEEIKLSQNKCPKLLIGTKSDLPMAYDKDIILSFSRNNDIEYFGTSAKTDTYVKEACDYMAFLCIEYISALPPPMPVYQNQQPLNYLYHQNQNDNGQRSACKC